MARLMRQRRACRVGFDQPGDVEAQFEKIWKNQGQKILPLALPTAEHPREVTAPALSILPCLIQPQESLKCAGFKPRKSPALNSHPRNLHTHAEALGQASVCLCSLRAAPILLISKENPASEQLLGHGHGCPQRDSEAAVGGMPRIWKLCHRL